VAQGEAAVELQQVEAAEADYREEVSRKWNRWSESH
jgi:hypothetical protein